MNILFWTIQILFVPAVSPLMIGIIRKFKAMFQKRIGASIFQPYKDIIKLLNKDEVISKDASWIFRFAPYIIFCISILIGASIPIFTTSFSGLPTSEIIVVVYTLAIGTFFLALAGMDVGGAFGGFGSSREMTISAFAEGGLIFSLLTIALISGSTNLFNISNNILLIQGKSIISLILAMGGFILILLAETKRFPFDNPSTHLELTMIHEAMTIEHSGKKLALLEWAAANKLAIFSILLINMFFPWGIATNFDILSIMVGFVSLIVKILIVLFGIAFLESTIAKFRFFRLPDLLLDAYIINILAICLIPVL